MNTLLGQQVGAFPHVANRLNVAGLLFVDATAGDGTDDASTPRLVLHHAQHGPIIGRVSGICIERDRTTFQTLCANLSQEALIGNGIVALWHGDARELAPAIDRTGKALVYLDDPNTSATSTLSPSVLDWLFEKPATTVFSAIGANAGGVARLDKHYSDSLVRYVDLLNRAEQERRFRRTAVFVRIPNDAHRWGYLIVGSDRFEQQMQAALDRIRRVWGGQIVSGFDSVRAALTEQHTRVRTTVATMQPSLI